MSFLPPRQVDDQTLRYVGIDLAKRESQLVALDHTGMQIACHRFETTRENVLALCVELTGADTVVMEVTTNAYFIARLIRAHTQAKLILSNPIKTRAIAEAKIKTDKIDARVLAELARADYLPQVWLPDEDTEALRHLFCDRRSLVDRRTELKNTVHSILHRNLITNPYADLFGTGGRSWLDRLCTAPHDESSLDSLDVLRLRAILLELDRLELSLNDVEGVIAAFIAARENLRADLDRLLSIPGVSLVVGAGLLSAIGEVSRFPSAKKLAAYFGLVPSTYQSGDTRARHGRITKQGRSQARWLTVEAAEHLRKAPGPMRALYTRVCHKRGHNVAVVAVARKLTELVWHLLTKGEDFLYANPKRTMDKRADVRKLAHRKTKRRAASASPRLAGRAALYGSGLKGKDVKAQVARRAAEEAEAIYAAVVEHRRSGSATVRVNSVAEFNPLRPTHVEWQKVLERVAANLLKETSASPADKAEAAVEE